MDRFCSLDFMNVRIFDHFDKEYHHLNENNVDIND